MSRFMLHISLLLALVLSLSCCDKTPRGVLSVNDMADLIVDLQLAEAYIETHIGDFPSDSDKLVIKQSVFMKHGISQQDYDTSLVWYAHNMEDYTKAYDKALGILNKRSEKIKSNANGINEAQDISGEPDLAGAPTHYPKPRGKRLTKFGADAKGDTADLWQGKRSYMLTQGLKRGFIPFELQPDANKKRGDRYQLAYKLTRGGNEFKVSLNVDYTDGSTSQITRGTNSDGWVTVDLQSDTARQVRRIYGYVSYDIKRGHTAYVDSMMLIRTHLSLSNYGYIHAQRKFERRQ